MTTYVHTINPQIAKQIGESESILLNQIDYWLSKSGKSVDNLNGKWIYNSHKEWLKQFSYWSLSKLRRTIKSLENLGLIISVKVNSKKWNQTKWYTIDYEKYAELFKREYLKSYNYKLPITEKKQSINNYDCLVDSLVSNTDRSNSSHFKKNKVNKSKNSALKVKKKISKKESKNSKDIKLNIHKNTPQSPKVCICSKWTNQSVQNEQMLIVTKNNYTNISSYKKNTLKKEEDSYLNDKNLGFIKEMTRIWNEVFKYSLSPIRAYNNKKNISHLLNILHKCFNNNLNLWREYAVKVNSSQFLMGEKETKKNFKATFSWLIKPETIEKIINNEYGVGDRELDMNNISKKIDDKKEEIVNKMDKKISEYMKIKINDKKEREEFKEYVEKASITEDDSYGILKNIIKQVPKNYILEREEYKGIRENLYESFVMKKYLGSTKLDIRNKIREKTREIDEITNIKGKIKILREIEEKIKTKEFIEYSTQSNKEIGDCSASLL